jgi:hypothetical protein
VRYTSADQFPHLHRDRHIVIQLGRVCAGTCPNRHWRSSADRFVGGSSDGICRRGPQPHRRIVEHVLASLAGASVVVAKLPFPVQSPEVRSLLSAHPRRRRICAGSCCHTSSGLCSHVSADRQRRDGYRRTSALRVRTATGLAAAASAPRPGLTPSTAPRRRS